MRSLAEFVMRGRKEAILVALLGSLIPIFGGMIASTITGLVTLRKGAIEGLWVVAITALPSVGLAFWGKPSLLLYQVLYGTLLVWVLALVLREHRTWRGVLEAAAFLGILGVLAVHLYQPEIAQIWETRFTHLFQLMDMKRYTAQWSPTQLQSLISNMAKYATGTRAAFILLNGLSGLVLARWIQSQLYHPGGFREEFYTIQLGFPETSALILGGLAALANIQIIPDFLPVIVLPFLIAGLSLVHSWANQKKNAWFWIIGFYVLLILSFPYGLALLVLLALFDSGYHFRDRLTKLS